MRCSSKNAGLHTFLVANFTSKRQVHNISKADVVFVPLYLQKLLKIELEMEKPNKCALSSVKFVHILLTDRLLSCKLTINSFYPRALQSD